MKVLCTLLLLFPFIKVQAQSNKYVNDSLAFDAKIVTAEQIPKNLKYDNNIQFALKWNDNNGENYFIATIGKDKTPYSKQGTLVRTLYFYNISSFPFYKTEKIIENEMSIWCINGAILEFVKNSIYVTDLDNDSIAEITFALSSFCKNDTLPITQPNLTLSIIEFKDIFTIGGFSFQSENKNLTLENICCYKGRGLGSVSPSIAKKAQGMFNNLPFRMPKDFEEHIKKAWLNAVKNEFAEHQKNKKLEK